MMELSFSKDKCMKVSFKKEDRILKMFQGLPPTFIIEESGDVVTVYCAVGYEIRRDVFGLTPLQFRRVYNKLKVEGGRKLWRGDCIILEPEKNAVVIVRMASSELELAKAAAKKANESLSDYIRAAIFTRTMQELGL